ncbi:hypothetical protein [Paenibacillus sp. USHLN196]|uniref:hypothetical protein n=1 Tax=Paenibacillus sp. USHLN196 TaxID=3081291 RepID=UPI0030178AB2
MLNLLTLHQLKELESELSMVLKEKKREYELERCGYAPETSSTKTVSSDDLTVLTDPHEIQFMRWFSQIKLDEKINLNKYNTIMKISNLANISDEKDLTHYLFGDSHPYGLSAVMKYPALQISEKGKAYLQEEFCSYIYK